MTEEEIHSNIRYFLIMILLFFIFEWIILYLLNVYLKVGWGFNSLIIGISLIILGIYTSLFSVKLTISITKLNNEKISEFINKLKTEIKGINNENLYREDREKIYQDTIVFD